MDNAVKQSDDEWMYGLLSSFLECKEFFPEEYKVFSEQLKKQRVQLETDLESMEENDKELFNSFKAIIENDEKDTEQILKDMKDYTPESARQLVVRAIRIHNATEEALRQIVSTECDQQTQKCREVSHIDIVGNPVPLLVQGGARKQKGGNLTTVEFQTHVQAWIAFFYHGETEALKELGLYSEK